MEQTLQWELFCPQHGEVDSIPDKPGVYLICARSIAVLLTAMQELQYKTYDGYPVIYVGMAGRSLRNRDYKNHFTGTARQSTLRKSLGGLFGYTKQWAGTEAGTSKYRFLSGEEEQLSAWMKESLLLYYQVQAKEKCEEQEKMLIERYEPPLNLKDNTSEHNQGFRVALKALRRPNA